MPTGPEIEALKALVAHSQSLAEWSTLLVFVGLVGEIIITFAYTKDKHLSEIILGVACGVVIALGVYGEYTYSSKSARANAQLQSISEAQVAELNAKAEELRRETEIEKSKRIEIEDRVSWRRLAKEQQSEIASRLNRFSGQKVLLQYEANDLEADTFALDIAAALQSARWNVYEPLAVLTMPEGPVPLGTNQPLPTGVVTISTGDQAARNASLAVVHELETFGFDATKSPRIDSRASSEVFIIVDHRPAGAQGEAKLRREFNETQAVLRSGPVVTTLPVMQPEHHFLWMRDLVISVISLVIGAVIGIFASEVRDYWKAKRAKESFLRAIGVELDALSDQLDASYHEVKRSAQRFYNGGRGPHLAVALRTLVFTSQLGKLSDVNEERIFEIIRFYSDLGTLQQIFDAANQFGDEFNRTEDVSPRKDTLRDDVKSILMVLEEQISSFGKRLRELRAKLPSAGAPR